MSTPETTVPDGLGEHPRSPHQASSGLATDRRVATVARLRRARRGQSRRRVVITSVLAVIVLALVIVNLCFGHTNYSLTEVWGVIRGDLVPGASFTVGELRLPRTVLGLVAGLSFGLAGCVFQTMLRNPLASPDVVGISAGAGTGAAFAIIVLGLGAAGTSISAIVCALVVAGLIYLLSFRSGVSGTRLILIGIGVAAMLQAVTTYLLSRASTQDLQATQRWLAGSLNGAAWNTTLPAVLALVVLGPVLLGVGRHLLALQLGEETAAGLGVRVETVRILMIVGAVALIAFASAAAGPIAFVAFLSGPIAARLVGGGKPVLIPAALIGAVLVLAADFLGQYALGTRYPVGVITGVLGAPYLIYLIIRANRGGAAGGL
ncbi:MAG: FecCD family ABC transporter permease [Galactobacter sp.]